jgi:hypothetical protein
MNDNKLSAVINLGSDSLYLTIAERQKNKMIILEKLEYLLRRWIELVR